MVFKPEESIRYKRSRFSTRLPAERLYTGSHFWISPQQPDIWRIGFTKFAIRMLGEIVECGFEVRASEPVKIGQVVGWIEGFKATSDLFCVVEGEFQQENPDLETNIELVHRDPYGKGWLYAVRGVPDIDSVNVAGYVDILNTTIDKIQGNQN